MPARPALLELAAAVAGAVDAAGAVDPRAMTRALARCVSLDGMLEPAQREGSVAGYTRHVLYADPDGRFTIVSLVWEAGQASPVHAHDTWCGYAVLEGALVERGFRDAGDRAAVALTESLRPPGSTVFDPGGYAIHQLVNPGDSRCISVHVYGVGADRVATAVNRVYDERLAAAAL
ncbi:MAG TPA: cysteine dioxygenase family protein [Pelomicrobium sp.]|nr:cysteine dioxygenase family protein [Pelomicrobium sp.]